MRFAGYVSLFFTSFASKVSALFVFPYSAIGYPSVTDAHLKIAILCRDAYDDEVESSETFVSADTGRQAKVTLDGSQAIVCFRGSDSLDDWKINFSMFRVPFLSRKHNNSDLEVHSGFFISHNSIKAKIYAKLNAIIDTGECDSILFTGHSAGATLAAISAFDFQNAKNLEIEVVTFGSPKIGNAAFAADFNSKIKCTRIVNDNDGVALAPFFGGYHHVGEAIQLKNLAPEGMQGIWPSIASFARLDSIADHEIDSYIATIEAHLKKGS